MIAIGIPSFNEADNIRRLVEGIDMAAVALDEPVIIINADNSSQDGTAEIFQSIQTTNTKVSLLTEERGKGRNIRCILNYITTHDISYCLFVDGDVTSMEPEWLKKHIAEAQRGADYVVPNYSRNMQEGNATNHFFFPSLNYFTKGRAPYQPIAGDIGLSARFATYVQRLPWSRSTLGYGVDIYMMMHALFRGFNVVEIRLREKIHKASYEKMITIFEESATSYFEARKEIESCIVHFTREEHTHLPLLQGRPITMVAIEERIGYARALLAKTATVSLVSLGGSPSSLPSLQMGNCGLEGLDAETWAKVLAEHEKKRFVCDAAEIAQSLLPFYLLRVAAYLQEARTPLDAEKILARQNELIAEHYAQATL